MLICVVGLWSNGGTIARSTLSGLELGSSILVHFQLALSIIGVVEFSSGRSSEENVPTSNLAAEIWLTGGLTIPSSFAAGAGIAYLGVLLLAELLLTQALNGIIASVKARGTLRVKPNSKVDPVRPDP